MVRLVRDPGSIMAAHRALLSGETTPERLLAQTFDRMDQVEGQIQAWSETDRDAAMAQAKVLTQELRESGARSLLHGIPVAIKDVMDVRGSATRAGSRARVHQAAATMDADIVAKFRAAGAIITGKVHTTEFAYFDGVPPTRNPFNIQHTPGGSSGGPAAAVASGTALASVGTQTAGSVVRPAAYCGIAAFKPTTQALSCYGMVPLAPSFDTPGWFGYRTEDVCAVAQALPFRVGLDCGTTDTARARLAVIVDDVFDKAAVDVKTSVADAVARLKEAGHEVSHVPSPVSLQEIHDLHRLVLEFELARVHSGLLLNDRDTVTPAFIAAIDRGLQIADHDYQACQLRLQALRDTFWDVLRGYDALVAPAAPDAAPAGEATGDPRYIIPFTALGGPLLTVPVGIDRAGLPLGLMIGARPWADPILLKRAVPIATAIELPR